MKSHPIRRAHGFTLVELLVVIAIIAVLAAAGFAGGTAAMNRARKTTALSVCVSLEQGISNFFTEYGGMPVTSTANSDTDFDTVTDVGILKALLGQDLDLNPRGIKFINLKEGKGGKNGLIYSADGTTLESLRDPWGGPYRIRLDLDYDEVIKDLKPKGASTAKTLNGRRVAVWSDGVDGLNGTGKSIDDVTTW